MTIPLLSLIFLGAAIILGFVKKMNVGIISMGMAFVLGLIGHVDTNTILGGFPSKLFLTLLGTMFFFCLLQENNTLELLSKKMVDFVGGKTYLIPIIIYLVSFILSAAGPGAISVQSVMVIFAVSLALQMKASPILLGSMAILGAVGGTTSPIALSGIIVTDLTTELGMTNIAVPVFLGVSIANFICAVVLYVLFKGYKLSNISVKSNESFAKFDKGQKLCLLALLTLVVAVVGFRYDVELVSFALSVILILFGVVNEKAALKLIPWGVLLLICGVNVLMAVTKELGGIELLSNILASLMVPVTAGPIMGLTAGLMSWFSSANGVVLPTLIPTVTDISSNVGGNVTAFELIAAIVGGATVAGISPLSTGGSLILATYTQETNASETEQQSVFARLFLVSLGVVIIIVLFALVGGFKLFQG
ncbi:SLC13 family permease [Streptococcus merionis]|uniref:SLC13 family permease n=1 Tax=Streptococcus merionis TaxID=400065 RepID=UPI0026ECEF3D|nr:SLC13 family permease [Streptococcus merionis]